MVLQLKTITCLLFKSMVEYIKTITCLLFTYGLNQNHCLLTCFKIWFTIKTIKYQRKTVYNNTLVFKKKGLEHSPFRLQNLSTTPHLLRLCFYLTHSKDYGENINRLRNRINLTYFIGKSLLVTSTYSHLMNIAEAKRSIAEAK